MKEQALQVVKGMTDPNDRINRLREYLQAFILRSLHESGAFSSLSFVGGTALRFLYDLPRFSEDLDFSLDFPKGYRLEAWLEKLTRDLTFANLESAVLAKEERVVHQAWVRTPGLLYEAGLTHRKEQNLSIKIEIDARPPSGACFESRVVNRYFLFTLRHHNLASLMAGKISALLTRPYQKGRDYYDLLWYLSRRPRVEPNLQFLSEALRQTEKDPPSATNWKSCLLKKFEEVDWKKIVSDVESFLERPAEAGLLTKENLVQLLTSS